MVKKKPGAVLQGKSDGRQEDHSPLQLQHHGFFENSSGSVRGHGDHTFHPLKALWHLKLLRGSWIQHPTCETVAPMREQKKQSLHLFQKNTAAANSESAGFVSTEIKFPWFETQSVCIRVKVAERKDGRRRSDPGGAGPGRGCRVGLRCLCTRKHRFKGRTDTVHVRQVRHGNQIRGIPEKKKHQWGGSHSDVHWGFS